jgi:hypothetical protein
MYRNIGVMYSMYNYKKEEERKIVGRDVLEGRGLFKRKAATNVLISTSIK